MFDVISLSLLAVALIAPPVYISKSGGRLSWSMRYLLAIIPLAYTALGWQLGEIGYSHLSCHGDSKNIHDCIRWGMDFTSAVNHGVFLMIPCVFIALPLSASLLVSTVSKQIGTRR
jgi:hypothetical protein